MSLLRQMRSKEILCQKYENAEFILVDDGSTDDSGQICDRYALKDDRIIVLPQENAGACAARNNGLEHASGKWISFIDGDDYVLPDICTNFEDVFDSDYDILMFSHVEFLGEKRRTINHKYKEKKFSGRDDFIKLQQVTLNRVGKYEYNIKVLDTVSLWNKLYRKEFLDRNSLRFVDGFPKLQDTSFNLMVYGVAEKALFRDTPGYCYRLNPDSVTRRYQPNIDKKFQIINCWFENYVFSGKNEYLIKPYWERISTHLRTCVVLKYCNRNNTACYRTRKKEFLEMIREEPYLSARRCSSCFNYPLRESILSFAIKHELFWVCEVLSRLNELL